MLSEEQIKAELQKLMQVIARTHGAFRPAKGFDHKSLPTDLGSWKLVRSHTNKRGIKFDVYRCPLRSQCGCEVSMRVVIGPDFIELQRCGLHDKNSHDNDQSKKIDLQANCFGGGGRQDCDYPFRHRAPQKFV